MQVGDEGCWEPVKRRVAQIFKPPTFFSHRKKLKEKLNPAIPFSPFPFSFTLLTFYLLYSMATEFSNPLRKFKLVFLGEQSGKPIPSHILSLTVSFVV
jgi:hypothetical protein